MKVEKRDLIDIFIIKHPQSRKPLLTWLQAALSATWRTPSDIKKYYRSVDFLSGNRIIFNIAGNKYRLTIQAIYTRGTLLILAIQTHADYSKHPAPPPIDWT